MRLLPVVLFLALPCFAHGGIFQPPPSDEPTPPDRPVRPPPPPEPPPPPTFDPESPVTPPETPKPPPDAPPPPPDSTTPSTRLPIRRGRTSAGGNSWRLWWEYNREHLLGMRGELRRRGTVTGTPTGERDPMRKHRAKVLGALRETARRAENRTLRAAAIIALGRMGGDDDARLIVRLLHDRRQSRDVHEAAAVALGILPPIKDAATRKAAHEFLRYASTEANVLATRAKGLALLSTGLRARSEPSLLMFLIGEAGGTKLRTEEAANLALALGLAADPMAAPELLTAVRKGKLGGRKLTDIGRAHAAQGLAWIGDANATPLLSSLLVSRSAGLQVRRSAALALGRMLRERELGKAQRSSAERALLRALEKGQDTVLRGFAAVSLGGARKPAGTIALMAAIDSGGNAQLKPYCALALGLAARSSGDRRIRHFLVEELDKTNAAELSSALSIAIGLAGAEGARTTLVKRLRSKSLSAPVRGAAAEGLGLMRTAAPEAARVLERLALKGREPRLVGDVVLALGLMGRRGVAGDLARLLRKTRSGTLQGRLILALGLLDHEAAVEPLLEILQDKRARSLVREFAAVALGMMGDRRAQDLLFSLDAYFNFHATTISTHELIRLY